MDAKNRLHALTDTDIPMALTYPTPSLDITITPLHFFKSDIANDPGWYRFANEDDKQRYSDLTGKIRTLKRKLVEKEQNDTLTNEDVDQLENLCREKDAIRTIKCHPAN